MLIQYKNEVTIKSLEESGKLMFDCGAGFHMIYKDHRGYVVDKCCENADRYNGLIIRTYTNLKDAKNDFFKAESWYINFYKK